MHILSLPSCALGVAGSFVLSFIVSASTADTIEWNIAKHSDPFTDVETCHAEFDRPFRPSSEIGGHIAQYAFFIERRATSVRVGFQVRGPMVIFPFPGDVQMRVDDKPTVTITAADTPLDLGGGSSGPDLDNVPVQDRGAGETAEHRTLQNILSFRALEGQRAIAFLSDIAHGKRTIWRVLGTIETYNASGELPDVRPALSACDVELQTSE